MIEWYFHLSIAAAVIIFNLNHVAEHPTPGDYFMSSQEFGLKRGTVLLWMSFLAVFPWLLRYLLSIILDGQPAWDMAFFFYFFFTYFYRGFSGRSGKIRFILWVCLGIIKPD